MLALMRLASLSPAVTEILFAIGAEKDIVCVDKFSDTPDGARAIAHLKDHQRIGDDELLEYRPEVVFTQTLVQEKLAVHLKSLEQFAVIHSDPRSLADIYDAIRSIGMLVGREKQALELIASMQQGFSQLQKKAKLLPRKPRFYIEEWHNPPMASGNWVPEIAKLAGGVSFPLEHRAPSREVALDEVQRFDPDIIVLSICGAGKLAEKRLLTGRDGWADLRAVADNHLFVIDDSLLNRPGPRLVEGAQRLYGWAFETLH